MKIPVRIHCGLLVSCAVLITTLPAHAEDQTFTTLLAQAKAQAAAGHLWTPAGNNMTETTMRMMDLIPQASAVELAELTALLRDTKPGLPLETSRSNASPEERSPQASPTPSTNETTLTFATAAPTPPPPLPDHVGRSDLGRTSPDKTRPEQISSHASILYAQGLDAEGRGDFSGARRFYIAAAQQGYAAAARNLGRLYDPSYVKRTTVGGVDPDPALARHWYERAVTLGDTETGQLLEALQ